MNDQKKKKGDEEDELDADAVEDVVVGDAPNDAEDEEDESEWTDGIEDTEDEY